MGDTSNPFGEFEEDFKKSDKAAPGAVEKLYPEGTYKFVLTTKDLKDDGVLHDWDHFEAKTGTKGFKLFPEFLEPLKVVDPKSGEEVDLTGVVLEHVFWVTKKNLPYVKRDLSTIAGRDIETLGEAVKTTWAGRTFEGVLRHEADDKNVMRNRIAFINPWSPPQDEAKTDAGTQKEAASKPSATTAAKPQTATKAAAGAKKSTEF